MMSCGEFLMPSMMMKHYFQMDQGYTHINSGEASTDTISIELFSEDKLNADIKASLSGQLTSKLPKAHGNRILIIGGRVGITSELLLPYSTRIDVVVEPDFLPILQALLVKKETVNYTFYREGLLGQKHTIPRFEIKGCEINVVQISKFHEIVKNSNEYDVVLLQNILIHPQINIVHELMRLSHQVLITMIVPGKIAHSGLFELLSGIEQNILHVFYDQESHERLEYVRYLTGRKQEINFWEIFVWKKKNLIDSDKQLKEIEALLEEEVKKNSIGDKIPKPSGDINDSPALLAQYEDIHFGEKKYFGIKNFPQHCAELVMAETIRLGMGGRALEVGCALGRCTLEMAAYFKEVVGIDQSKSFVEHANKNLEQKYSDKKEKVKIILGDAYKLDKQLGKFDVIFAGNLIDQLADPQRFLVSLPQFLNQKGLIVLASSYAWLKEKTPEEKWLGGRIIDGKETSTYQNLKKMMGKLGLKQSRESEDIRLVVKENPWVFQYTSTHVTYWCQGF